VFLSQDADKAQAESITQEDIVEKILNTVQIP